MKSLLRIRILTTLTLSLITILILLYLTINFSHTNELQDLSVNISNRTTPPAGAQLLQNGIGITNGAPMRDGNFQVEGYCNIIGGQVSENGVNWFCGSRMLTPEDFDEICKLTYNVSRAIAIKNGTGSREAYRWRCYSLPQTTVTSTPTNTPTQTLTNTPTSTPTPISTPTPTPIQTVTCYRCTPATNDGNACESQVFNQSSCPAGWTNNSNCFVVEPGGVCPAQITCYRCTPATNDGNTCESQVFNQSSCPAGWTNNSNCFTVEPGGVCPAQVTCYRCTPATNDGNACESQVFNQSSCPVGWTDNSNCFAIEPGRICPSQIKCEPCGPVDCNQDGRIDIIDFACFAQKYNKTCYMLL